MSDGSHPSRAPLVFASLGHIYVHCFTAFYFVIVLAVEVDWQRPYHELISLWTLGARQHEVLDDEVIQGSPI